MFYQKRQIGFSILLRIDWWADTYLVEGDGMKFNMENLNVIEKALELFDEADNLAKDWLIKSWGLSGEDKEIARLYYQKACKKRAGIAKRMEELCNPIK